jgi:hypothetical protein
LRFVFRCGCEGCEDACECAVVMAGGIRCVCSVGREGVLMCLRDVLRCIIPGMFSSLLEVFVSLN